MIKIFLLLFLSLNFSLAQAPAHIHFWIIWNVGQGQWITEVTNQSCKHFDFGGEIHFFKVLQKKFIHFCSTKNNELYLSHADLDHYGYLDLIANRVLRICWRIRPDFIQNPTAAKISLCKNNPHKDRYNSAAKIINQTIINACDSKDKNSCSTIFHRKDFLFTGDSPKFQEKRWFKYLKTPEVIKILLLGHHGSRTATSLELLRRLSSLKMTVVSARQKKYGHPHPKTVSMIKQHRLPLIKTEVWGNLIFSQF